MLFKLPCGVGIKLRPFSRMAVLSSVSAAVSVRLSTCEGLTVVAFLGGTLC